MCGLDALPANVARVDVRGFDEQPERGLAVRQVLARQDAIDFDSPEILRSDRCVRAYSEETVVLLRRHGGEQLALAWRERPAVAHHRLGEGEQVAHGLRPEGEKAAEIRLSVRLGRGVDDFVEIHGLVMVSAGAE